MRQIARDIMIKREITLNFFLSLFVRHQEIILTGLLALWGIAMLIFTPPFQVPDEFAHYNRAFQISERTIIPIKRGQLLGGELPQILKSDQMKFNHLPFFAERKLSFENYSVMLKDSPAMTSENLKTRAFYDFPNTAVYSPVPYLFSGLGIATARFFAVTVLNGFYVARLFNLLAALGIIYAAMRLLRSMPELQLMLFLVAGMPMTTFELMSVSADSITFAFAVMVFACIANLSLQWNRRVYATLLASAFLLGLCKQAYVLLPCASLVFWKSVPGSLYKKISQIVIIIACAVIPMVVWSKCVQDIYVPHLKNVYIDPIVQMKFFMAHWPALLKYFIENIFYDNFIVYAHSMYGVLGWLDTPLSRGKAAQYFFLCLASVLILLKRNFPYGRETLVLSLPLKARLLSLLIVLCSVFAIVISLYLSWNPVGVISLEGIQGRYFIPLLPFALLVFYRLLPINLTKPYYASWMMFCLAMWTYFSYHAVIILRARYWVV